MLVRAFSVWKSHLLVVSHSFLGSNTLCFTGDTCFHWTGAILVLINFASLNLNNRHTEQIHCVSSWSFMLCSQICKFNVHPCKMIGRRMQLISNHVASLLKGYITCKRLYAFEHILVTGALNYNTDSWYRTSTNSQKLNKLNHKCELGDCYWEFVFWNIE